MTPRLALTIPEAAARLGFSEQHFRRHVLKDVGIVYVGSLARVRCADLEAWLDRQTATKSDGTEERGSSDAQLTAPVTSAPPDAETREIERKLLARAAKYSARCAAAKDGPDLRLVQPPPRTGGPRGA